MKKGKDAAPEAGLPPPKPDPTLPGCYVDYLVVGAPPETKRRSERLFWRSAPVTAVKKADETGAPPEVVKLKVPATVALRDGLKFRGLLVSVLKATPPSSDALADHAAAVDAKAASPDDDDVPDPGPVPQEEFQVVAASTVPLHCLLEPQFGADIPGNSEREQIKLVECAKLDFNQDFLETIDHGEPPADDDSNKKKKKDKKPRGNITVVVRLNPGPDD